MKTTLVAALLLGLGSTGALSGQTDQTESVLDRIVPEQPSGGPFALTPPLPTWSDGAVLSVGRTAGIVVGFEAAPEVKEVGAIATAAIAASVKAHGRISLAGKTVREALDTIVAIDPRYRWIDVHGVPVVRPWASWTDPEHPLNQVVAPIVWPEIDLATALSKVSALVSGTDLSGPVPGSGRGPVFAVETGPIAVMELLNAIGLAHGGGVGWSMRHSCSTADPRAIYIEVLAYDGHQPHGLGSCRSPRSNDAKPHR
jgi:hypothetical protein